MSKNINHKLKKSNKVITNINNLTETMTNKRNIITDDNITTDNGYSKWKSKRREQKQKRKIFILKAIIPFTMLSLFIFLFGYDAPMFDEHKIIEFSCAYIGIVLIILIISVTKYKINKYIPACNNCGQPIKNLEKDCVIGNIEYLGTVDRIKYENSTSTVKGTTVYPRGGYSMRNDIFERTSESHFEINQKIPVVKSFHVYNIEYKCKNCNTPYCSTKIESLEPLNSNTNNKRKK